MTLGMMAALAAGIAIGLGTIGNGIGQGLAIANAMEAMGRQPQAAPQIQIAMVIGAAFIEAVTIYALLTVFIFQGRVI